MFVTCVEVGTTSQPPGIRHVSRIQLTLRGEERHPSILGPGALRALSNASNFSSWPGASSTKGFHSNVSSFTPRASGPREWKHVLYLRESWAYFPASRNPTRIKNTTYVGGRKTPFNSRAGSPPGAFQRIQLFLLARSLLHERFPLQRFIFHAESLGAERVETCSLPA